MIKIGDLFIENQCPIDQADGFIVETFAYDIDKFIVTMLPLLSSTQSLSSSLLLSRHRSHHHNWQMEFLNVIDLEPFSQFSLSLPFIQLTLPFSLICPFHLSTQSIPDFPLCPYTHSHHTKSRTPNTINVELPSLFESDH